jgi:hypothetical protein
MSERENLEQIGHAMMLAWGRIKKAQARMWGDWMTIGEGLLEGRRWAMQMAGTNKPEGKGYVTAYAEWLKRYKVDDMDKSDRAKLLQLMEERPGVEEWRATLTDYERRNLNNPTIAWRKWTAATRVKKPKPRSAGVSATEQGRAQATVEQLEARVEELEQELVSAKAPLSAQAPLVDYDELEWEQGALDDGNCYRGNLVARLVAAAHYWVGLTDSDDDSKGYSATFIREDESAETLGENLSLEAAQELCTRHFAKPSQPTEADAGSAERLVWTGNEEDGYLTRALVDGRLPIAYAVVPVNFRGGPHFEANIFTNHNIDFTLPVKRLAARYGMHLHTHDAKGRRRTLNPVPTAAEAKALAEADYARQ